MRIARQGRGFIWAALACAAAGGALAVRPGWLAPGAAVCALALAFAGFCAYFFRDPERPLPADASKIYSPGDGRVLSVAREGPGDITTVRVFLSIFDVHVQRAPVSGRVDMVRYQPGAFRMAMAEEARRNERNVVRIASEARSPGGAPREPVVVEQIAGFVARRIECWVKEGDRLRAGERYGMIRFGSQAALHLPAGTRALVKPGDRVAGGITEVAEWTA